MKVRFDREFVVDGGVCDYKDGPGLIIFFVSFFF